VFLKRLHGAGDTVSRDIRAEPIDQPLDFLRACVENIGRDCLEFLSVLPSWLPDFFNIGSDNGVLGANILYKCDVAMDGCPVLIDGAHSYVYVIQVGLFVLGDEGWFLVIERTFNPSPIHYFFPFSASAFCHRTEIEVPSNDEVVHWWGFLNVSLDGPDGVLLLSIFEIAADDVSATSSFVNDQCYRIATVNDVHFHVCPDECFWAHNGDPTFVSSTFFVNTRRGGSNVKVGVELFYESELLLIPSVFLNAEYIFVGEFHNSVEVVSSFVEKLMNSTHVPSGDFFDVRLMVFHISWSIPGDVNC
jgi:hypothetical protein